MKGDLKIKHLLVEVCASLKKKKLTWVEQVKSQLLKESFVRSRSAQTNQSLTQSTRCPEMHGFRNNLAWKQWPQTHFKGT